MPFVPCFVFKKGTAMFKKKISPKKQERLDRRIAELTSMMTSPQTDPQGMYTGVPADPYETPVQDADDL